MKPSTPRNTSLAYLWLFSAGVDPAGADTAGDALPESLGKLLDMVENRGRREAAGHFIAVSEEFEHEEPTLRIVK